MPCCGAPARAKRVTASACRLTSHGYYEQLLEAGVRVYANLYGDTLGPPGSPGATYIGMERWNMRAMVAGFLGTPPPQA